MSITLLGELPDRPVTDANGDFSTSRKFQVKTTANETGFDVLKLAGIPATNEQHPDNANLYCSNRIATPVENGEVWEVECSYSPPDQSGGGGAVPPGGIYPWDLPPYDINFSNIGLNRVLTKSYDSGDLQFAPTKDVLNSAYDPFDPPLEYVKHNMIMAFSYDLQTFNVNNIINFQSTLNKNQIPVIDYTIPAGQGKLNQISAVVKEVKDTDGSLLYTYYTISVKIEIAEDHNMKTLDAGFYALDPNGIRYEIKLDQNGVLGNDGEVITEPALLDGSGNVQQPGSSGVYLPFNPYFAKDWTDLSLPESME